MTGLAEVPAGTGGLVCMRLKGLCLSGFWSDKGLNMQDASLVAGDLLGYYEVGAEF